MKQTIKKIYNKLAFGKLNPIFSFAMEAVAVCEYAFFCLKWKLERAAMPSEEDIKLVNENVTFIYKSFERQKMARGLYRNIQKFYPGVKVIIADDSKKPLQLDGGNLQIIQLPFNSGLGYGISRALESVETPYLIRMDDDELLTPHTNFHKQLRFLMEHPEVDIAAVSYISTPYCESLSKVAQEYYKQSMSNAQKELKIPHKTRIDEDHIVLGKVPNVFLARTKAVKSVGYDDNIRIIDHHEFFYRAAGNLVSVLDEKAYIFHRHNNCDASYRKYRLDLKHDSKYIREKFQKRDK